MENKNEKSMTLEEMIGEMLKDAKVVKVPLPVKAEEEKKAQKQDKPMPARPLGAPLLSINIENLHLHMDERMTSYNYGFGQEPDAEADDPAEDIDFDEMLDRIHKETGLCEKVILAVLKAQADYLDDLWGEEEENGEKEALSDKATDKPVAKAETQSAVTITKDEITAVIVAKIKKKRDNNEKIGQLLKTYGVAQLSDLPAEKYEAFLADVSQI